MTMARGSPLNDQERVASSTPSLVNSRESSVGISDIPLLRVDPRGVEPARGGCSTSRPAQTGRLLLITLGASGQALIPRARAAKSTSPPKGIPALVTPDPYVQVVARIAS